MKKQATLIRVDDADDVDAPIRYLVMRPGPDATDAEVGTVTLDSTTETWTATTPDDTTIGHYPRALDAVTALMGQ